MRKLLRVLATMALLITACTSAADNTASTEPTPSVQVPGTSTLAPEPEPEPTVEPEPDPAPSPTSTATEKLTLGLPDVAAAQDIELAPLGTFVFGRPDAGILRAAAEGETAAPEIPVYDTPFGPPRTLLDTNDIDGFRLPVGLTNWPEGDGARVLRVIAGGPDDDWLIVQAPVRPNDSYVWVRRSDFDFGFTDMRIEIDLAGEGRLTLFNGGTELLRSDIVQGRESRPTPTHVTYIERGVRGIALSPAYGTAVLSMASFSEALGTFGGGGLPSNFLHGTNQPELMGQRVSSGEIRLPNEVLDEIIETITPGTPVLLFDSNRSAHDRDAVLQRALEPAATIGFAEGGTRIADGTTGVRAQLWQRCADVATEVTVDLLCRAGVDVGERYAYLVAKEGAGEFDDEVGANVIPVYDVPGGPPRMLVHEPPDGIDRDSRVPLRHPGTADAPLVLWPLERSPDGRWYLVQAPIRPGRRSVWVRSDDFDVRATDYRIEIDLAGPDAGDLSVFDGEDRVLYTDMIVSGRETRPTPLGESYIDQVLDGSELSPAYGLYVLSFPLYSETLETFNGGRLPRQSIHGTNQPELMGQRTASGHIRLTNEMLTEIVDLPGGILGARVITFDSTGLDREAAIEQQSDAVWLPARTTEPDNADFPLGTPDF